MYENMYYTPVNTKWYTIKRIRKKKRKKLLNTKRMWQQIDTSIYEVFLFSQLLNLKYIKTRFFKFIYWIFSDIQILLIPKSGLNLLKIAWHEVI